MREIFSHLCLCIMPCLPWKSLRKCMFVALMHRFSFRSSDILLLWNSRSIFRSPLCISLRQHLSRLSPSHCVRQQRERRRNFGVRHKAGCRPEILLDLHLPDAHVCILSRWQRATVSTCCIAFIKHSFIMTLKLPPCIGSQRHQTEQCTSSRVP